MSLIFHSYNFLLKFFAKTSQEVISFALIIVVLRLGRDDFSLLKSFGILAEAW